MCDCEPGLAAFSAINAEPVPATFAIGLVPAADGVVVEIEKLRDDLTGLAVIL